MIKLGGLFSLFGGLAFVAVFTYLAINFNYPEILDGDAYQVFPKMLDGGTTMRSVWALYAFLPLTLIPAAIGTYSYLKNKYQTFAVAGLIFAALSALGNMLGLMRWPSIHWILAEKFVTSNSEQQHVINAVFQGLNVYLGNYIGEFFGELMINLWFLTIGLALINLKGRLKYFGYFGIITSVLGLVGAFRNVASVVSGVAEINNFLLPMFLVLLGIVLIGVKKELK